MILRPMPVTAGELKSPFRHQSPSNIVDMHGAPQTSWLERGIVWGAFEQSAARAQTAASVEEAEQVAQIIVRYRPADPCAPGDRLVGRVVWRVNAVADPDGTERYQRLYCTAMDVGS